MRKFLVFLCLTLVMGSTMVPAFAVDPIIGSGIAGETDTKDRVPGSMYDDIDVESIIGVPKVGVEDIQNKVQEKGNDVLSIIQTVGKYVCIGAFILACVGTIVFMFANHKVMWVCIGILIFSGISYAGIVCGPEIVQYIAAWAAS